MNPQPHSEKVWFRGWWPVTIVLVALTGFAVVSGVSRAGDDPGWLLLALFLTVATAGVILMPWNCSLTGFDVDERGVTVWKWPGVWTRTIPWADVAEVTVVDSVYSTVFRGRSRTGQAEIPVSRTPIVVEAYTDQTAVLVTPRSGGRALLLPPGQLGSDALAALIDAWRRTRR